MIKRLDKGSIQSHILIFGLVHQALVRSAACPRQVGLVGDEGGQVQPDHDVPGETVAPFHGNC